MHVCMHVCMCVCVCVCVRVCVCMKVLHTLIGPNCHPKLLTRVDVMLQFYVSQKQLTNSHIGVCIYIHIYMCVYGTDDG